MQCNIYMGSFNFELTEIWDRKYLKYNTSIVIRKFTH